MIEPNLQSVSKLFGEESQFVVPEYQRGYAWTIEEVSELIEDIWTSIGKDQGLYLGTIILDTSRQRRKRLEVVDGQQRLTTLLILLIALRERAKALGMTEKVHAIQRKVTFTDELDNKFIGMRLIVPRPFKAFSTIWRIRIGLGTFRNNWVKSQFDASDPFIKPSAIG